jgi:hypothetical protein
MVVRAKLTRRIFIVMPFIEHDVKTLLSDMPHPFLQSEVKTIMIQLLSAMAHCHANWIVSRRQCTHRVLPADFCLAAPRSQDVKSAYEQPRDDQSRRLRTRTKVWRSPWRDDPAGSHAMVPVSRHVDQTRRSCKLTADPPSFCWAQPSTRLRWTCGHVVASLQN